MCQKQAVHVSGVWLDLTLFFGNIYLQYVGNLNNLNPEPEIPTD